MRPNIHKGYAMFLPASKKEMEGLGWTRPDIILVTGDAYIDSPFIGVAVIGRVLSDKGYKVGIIAQPDLKTGKDITSLGEPALFWGITGGSVDSMVANYTALKKKRKSDDYTPGGINNRRPDRAVIAYTNLIRQYFKQTRPIVLGGIEASLRRIAHYDFWSDSIRRSILLDAKADYLLYGMAHDSVLEFASALKQNLSVADLRGIAYISKEKKGLVLPSYEAVKESKTEFIKAFQVFYENNDALSAKPLCQKHQDRYVVINPPLPCSSTEVLDHIHSLAYERNTHPFHRAAGRVKALDTIRFSIPTHYGCYGECHFCAITVHQGRTVCSRSEASIVAEAKTISRLPDFKGYILDLGGPTANMYGFECKKKLEKGPCRDKRCLFPSLCRSLCPDHSRHLDLIRKIEALPGIKKVFISSGIRYDLIFGDQKNAGPYLEKLVKDHVSGQMKIAPEHTGPHILSLMGKQGIDHLIEFKKRFDELSKKAGKAQFLTYYLIAAHPGCTLKDMQETRQFCLKHLKILPEQVQIFTPTPLTWSALMYYTGINPFTMESLFVEKELKKKKKQKQVITTRLAGRKKAGAAIQKSRTFLSDKK